MKAGEGLNAAWRGRRGAFQLCAMGVLALLFAAFQSPGAAIATEWTQREFANFRLLPNTTAVDASNEVLIGLEIDLDAGWQFYSKAPGEFGVAPEFDWTTSRNLARASIYWPKPTRYLYSTDPPISTLGYKGSLLLPVVLAPEKRGDELDVRMVLDYAVCDEFCIFDTVDLRLTLAAGPGRATRFSERLQQALAVARAAIW